MDPVVEFISSFQEAWEPNENQDTRLEEFQRQLESNPYYFVTWFENGPNDIRSLSAYRMNEFRQKLFGSTKRPRSKREIEAVAVSRDIFESEFSDRKTIVAFFIEAYLTAVLKMDGYEFYDPTNPETNKPKKYQIRSQKVSKWIRLAAQANRGGLQFAEKLALQGWAIKPEYMPAVTYLNKWGRLHLTLSKGKAPSTGNPDGYNGVEDFNALPKKSKALVMAAKSFYLASLRTVVANAKAESVEAMREAVWYDPYCFEWHCRLGNWVHRERRVEDFHSPPSDEEMQLRWETYEVCEYPRINEETGQNTMLRNMALGCVMETLAEILRYYYNQGLSRDSRFIFGNLNFGSMDEVVQFINENVRRLQEETYNPAFDELVRVGDIFASTLPKPFKNDTLAWWFYKKAYEMKPNNSKINHKLGLLRVKSCEFTDVPEAINLLEAAYLIDKNNMSALFDLLKTMLGSAIQYQPQINQYCEEALRSPTVTSNQTEKIRFIQGCVFICNGNIDDAVQCWINVDLSLFKCLNHWKWTHRWNHWNFNLLQSMRIKRQLESYLASSNRTIPKIRRAKVESIIHTLGCQELLRPARPIDEFRISTENGRQRNCQRLIATVNVPHVNDRNGNRFDNMPLEWRQRDQGSSRESGGASSGDSTRYRSHSHNSNSVLYQESSDNFRSGISGNWRSTHR